MTTNLQLAKDKDNPAPLRATLVEHVDVRVEAYLGGSTMTIGELNALQEGGVVTLSAALNAPIELRVNGVAIAEGELVAIGDKFAVRISSIKP